MPGRHLDGLGLARVIREKYPHVPILLATGYTEAARMARAEFPTLRKPYGPHELGRALSELTATKALAAIG
jgi:DNA-binding LytR/AlgR family response regulator